MKARKRLTRRIVKPARSEETQTSGSTPYRPYYVYGLAAYGVIFYIGMTNDMNRRYQQHLAGDDNLRKTGYIRKVSNRVEVQILDTTMDLGQAQQLEAFWILYYTLDRYYLTNTHAGAHLDLMALDEEHTEMLATMLQKRWSKEGAADWERRRWSSIEQGSWEHLKDYSKYASRPFVEWEA